MNSCRFAILILTIMSVTTVNSTSWLSQGNYDISWYNITDTEYIISTPQQFAGIAYLVNNGYTTFYGKTFKLSQDISLASYDWTAIGIAKTQPFRGIFDGQGFKISGLVLSHKSSTDYYGIWAYTVNASISNLHVEGNASFYYSDSFYPQLYLGAIVAYAESSKIVNCSVDFPIEYDREETNSSLFWDETYDIYMGGIVGCAYKTTLTHCLHSGDISFMFGTGISEYYSDGGAYIGGICGYSSDIGRIEYCGHKSEQISVEVSRSVNTNSYPTRIGGIVGGVGSVNIVACYNNTNKFIGTSYCRERSIYFGGISSYAGFWDFEPYGELTNCYSTTNIVEFYQYYLSGFSGICACTYANAPSKYAANFSPSDVTINHPITIGFSGSTTFTKEQMKETSFLNELNLYPITKNYDYKWEMGDEFPRVINPNTVGITEVKTDNETIRISTSNSVIKLSEPCFVEVYTVGGMLVYRGCDTSIPVASGMYIVKVNGKTYKAVI